MKIQSQTVIGLKPTSRIVLNNGFLLCVGVKLAKPMVMMSVFTSDVKITKTISQPIQLMPCLVVSRCG